jgi:transcriptional regulator with XRE-family HTH domain
MNKVVAKAVDYLLKKKGVKAKQLCRETGLDYNYFMRIRRGGVFKEDYIFTICKYFNVTADFLFTFDENSLLLDLKKPKISNSISELELEKSLLTLNRLEENFYYYIEDRELTMSRIFDTCMDFLDRGIFYQSILNLVSSIHVSCRRKRTIDVEFLKIKDEILNCGESIEEHTHTYNEEDRIFVSQVIKEHLLALNFLETYIFSRILSYTLQGEEDGKGSLKKAIRLFFEL